MTFELDTHRLETAFSIEDIALIRQQFLRAAELTQRLMPIDNVRIDFYVWQVPARWGMSASAPTSNLICFAFHPDNFLLRSNEHNGLVRYMQITAHELHHNKRWRSQGQNKTWDEMMVSDGLALKFQREVFPEFDAPEERHPRNGESLESLAERARPLVNLVLPEKGQPLSPEMKSVDHYHLGLAVVEGWCKYSGMTAAQAHDVPAKDIIEPWLSGKFSIVLSPPPQRCG